MFIIKNLKGSTTEVVWEATKYVYHTTRHEDNEEHYTSVFEFLTPRGEGITILDGSVFVMNENGKTIDRYTPTVFTGFREKPLDGIL